ncbi:MAG: DUF721 domain-containing protein [Bacteroidales bacterium]
MKKARKESVVSLGDAIKEFLNQYKYSGKLQESEAINAWSIVMGKNINALTKSVYVSRKRLVVHLKSSVLRNELMMHRSKITKAINLHVGAEVIENVILK